MSVTSGVDQQIQALTFEGAVGGILSYLDTIIQIRENELAHFRNIRDLFSAKLSVPEPNIRAFCEKTQPLRVLAPEPPPPEESWEEPIPEEEAEVLEAHSTRS